MQPVLQLITPDGVTSGTVNMFIFRLLSMWLQTSFITAAVQGKHFPTYLPSHFQSFELIHNTRIRLSKACLPSPLLGKDFHFQINCNLI